MATTDASEVTDGPVLSLINKRLRGLRKKYNRILQMEESVALGKTINKEQEEVLRSKPSLSAAIDELEKLRQPLSAAVSEEIVLAIQRHGHQSSISDTTVADEDDGKESNCESNKGNHGDDMVEDLLNLLYFGSLFDVKSQNDFTATMLTRTHERGCCLTYDYVTDDATDLLGERDLDLISKLSGLFISRPVDSSSSHKNALQRCIEHAKLWLSNSDQPIEPNANVSYAGLRERLNKIMASDYFITTPEMKAPVEVVAAAAVGNYASFQVPVHGVPISMPVHVEGYVAQYRPEDEERANLQGHETGSDQHSLAEEPQKNVLETENPSEEVSSQQEAANPTAEEDHNQIEVQPKEQLYIPRRNYQNQRGGRGDRSRGYSNGRGGRNGGRGGGGYQNGRSQYYDQPGNYYPRNYHHNRGRGGVGGGGQPYNHGSAGLGGHTPADVGVAS